MRTSEFACLPRAFMPSEPHHLYFIFPLMSARPDQPPDTKTRILSIFNSCVVSIITHRAPMFLARPLSQLHRQQPHIRVHSGYYRTDCPLDATAPVSLQRAFCTARLGCLPSYPMQPTCFCRICHATEFNLNFCLLHNLSLQLLKLKSATSFRLSW